MIRVVIADDHHLVRGGLRALLERAGDIEVVGEADNGPDAVALVEQLRPDVLLVDISMPGLNGIEVVDLLRRRALPTRAVILSVHTDELLVRQALQAGASGYLVKRSASAELPLAVRLAHLGDRYVSPAVGGELGERPTGDPPRRPLTPREREVLRLVAEGATTAEIAAQLRISPKTVEKHRARLMAKLEVHNLAGLIRVAIRLGVISLLD